jgi:hypothetical protein
MAQAFTVQELKYLKMGVGLKLCETDMLLEDKAISRSFRKKLAREYRELIKLHNHLGGIFQGINRGD